MPGAGVVHYINRVGLGGSVSLFAAVVAEGDKACGARMAIMDLRYLNNAIASSASTPPVIEIGANGALAATSALDSMI